MSIRTTLKIKKLERQNKRLKMDNDSLKRMVDLLNMRLSDSEAAIDHYESLLNEQHQKIKELEEVGDDDTS